MNGGLFTTRTFNLLILVTLLLTINGGHLWAQSSYILSKHSDLSTDDRIFMHDDTLFMQVIAPEIDYTDIDENEYELKAEDGGDDIEAAFTNELNTFYTASLPLRYLNSSEENWRWKARIRDDSGHEFRVEVEISILGGAHVEELIIKGKIEDLGTNTLVVKGATIFLDDSTIITDKNDVNLSFTDLEIGENVEIKAVRQGNGDLLALFIDLRSRNKGELEVKGRIDSLGTDHLVVLGITFFVDERTSIQGEYENSISLTDLIVGQFVEIKAQPQSDSTLMATSVKVEDNDDNEIELTGIIQALADSSLTISEITFMVIHSTEIHDTQDNPISLNELYVGLLVKIKGEYLLDGNLTVTEIKIEDEVPDNDEIEVTGMIKEIGENKLIVSDIAFFVDENTMIFDEHKRLIALTDLQGGIVVEVKALVQTDGSFLAVRIQIEDRFHNEIEITGLVDSLGDSVLVVNNLQFTISENSVLFDHHKNPISFSQLSVGMTVEIHAQILIDGTHLVTKLEIEENDENEIELTGTIDSLGVANVWVSGLEFLVDASTQILDNKKNPIDFSALLVGQIVEIKGSRQLDETFLAYEIKIEDRMEDEVEVVGSVDDFTDDTITVLGLTFNVTENTVVLDNNKNPISLSDLSGGMVVKVRGELLPGGTLIAIRIKVEDKNQNQLEVKGPIDSLDINSVFVLGFDLQIDSNTEILDKKKKPINLSDLRIGQFVEAHAQKQLDDGFIATKIKVEDVVVILGSVSEIATNSFVMFNSEMLTDENTLVLGAQNLPLSFDDLYAGQTVEARAIKQVDGTLLASKIKLLNIESVTGVGDSNERNTLPEDFTLDQNYPNPFNPTTTIEFIYSNTSGAAQAQVSLIIYNILGQTVRTLLSQPLQFGNYKMQWDGRNDFGDPVPSGIYLYRLQSEHFSETRRMVFVK